MVVDLTSQELDLSGSWTLPGVWSLTGRLGTPMVMSTQCESWLLACYQSFTGTGLESSFCAHAQCTAQCGAVYVRSSTWASMGLGPSSRLWSHMVEDLLWQSHGDEHQGWHTSRDLLELSARVIGGHEVA